MEIVYSLWKITNNKFQSQAFRVKKRRLLLRKGDNLHWMTFGMGISKQNWLIELKQPLDLAFLLFCHLFIKITRTKLLQHSLICLRHTSNFITNESALFLTWRTKYLILIYTRFCYSDDLLVCEKHMCVKYLYTHTSECNCQIWRFESSTSTSYHEHLTISCLKL